MSEDSAQQISRSALRFFSGTILSKLSGMVRDMTMAFFLGTSSSLAAFLLAFRFVYLARRLFGESLLHQGFIPYFEEKRKQDPKLAALFFCRLFWSIVVFLASLFALIAVALSFFQGEAISLSKFLLPGMFFLCLFGFCTGLLQAEKSFFTPSVSPALSNVVWILGILCLRGLPSSQAMERLSLVLSFAFFLQWTLTLPTMLTFLRKHLSWQEMLKGPLFSSEIRTIASSLLFAMIGVAAVQINTGVDGIFARFASPEGPAYLWYAIRLQQLPLALFGIAFSSALLPSLSRAYEGGEMKRYYELLTFARKRTFALTFPCVIAIFVLGLSSVNLLFGRGDFSHFSTAQTTLCLWCYGLGLLPMALVQIYAPAFYAKKDYKTPTRGFVYAAVLNILLNTLFVFIMERGVSSIALATSISSAFNFGYLLQKLEGPKGDWSSSFRVLACGLIAGGLGGMVGMFFGNGSLFLFLSKENFQLPRGITEQLLHFSVQTGVFFTLFYLVCRWLKARDILDLYSFKLAHRKSTSKRSET